MSAPLRLFALAPLALSACFLVEGPSGGPMPQFEIDPSCELAGALVVEVGDGTVGFAPLADGAGPPINYGPQGGMHVFAGVRVGNLELERSDRVRVRLGLFDAEACPTLGEPCTGDPSWGGGEWVFADPEAPELVDAHTIEEGAMAIVLDELPANVVLQAIVEDTCGRVGLAQHDIAQI